MIFGFNFTSETDSDKILVALSMFECTSNPMVASKILQICPPSWNPRWLPFSSHFCYFSCNFSSKACRDNILMSIPIFFMNQQSNNDIRKHVCWFTILKSKMADTYFWGFGHYSSTGSGIDKILMSIIMTWGIYNLIMKACGYTYNWKCSKPLTMVVYSCWNGPIW